MARALTDRQIKFCEAFLESKGNQSEAARKAGYSLPAQSGMKNMQDPRVRQMIRDLALPKILELDNLANDMAKTMLLDPEAPAASKVQLIKAIWSQANTLLSQEEQELNEGKPLSERSKQELQEFVKAGIEKVAALRGADNARVINEIEEEPKALVMDLPPFPKSCDN